jgi:hypothetical protein
MINSQYDVFKIELIFENDMVEHIQSCQVIGTYFYYDVQKRRDIAQGNIRKPVNFVTPLKSNIITTTSNSIDFNINSSGQVNGFFIETSNINTITGIRLMTNGL